MKLKLSEITRLVGGELTGDGDIEIYGVNALTEANNDEITFAVPPHLEKAVDSKAAAIILAQAIPGLSQAQLIVANPREAFGKLLSVFAPTVHIARGVHPSAVLGDNVVLGENVAIMPHVVITNDAVIGDNTVIYPFTYIGEAAVIGKDCLLYPSVTVREHCRLGDRVIIHSGSIVGSDGFGFVTVGGKHRKVPQVGNAVIGDDVEIGANVAIDRATTGSTIVGNGTKIDNLVHLGHNDVIGENCLFVAQVGISGSVNVGNNVTFAGQVGSAGHLNIGDNCVFAARTGIISDVPANSFYAGFPARPHKEWLRSEAGGRKVPDMVKKMRDLEKRIAELEANR
ncbi:MAG: UDP-3-O-(3-hydroxymyristoyl) glucosamine N-acyltransferase [Anaerosporomusa subterranea]|nr:UDP-3-O-(3-hydroxymyristoyl) glucosamine N-acyltransferase [Anaerosporomusa subterranea]